MADRSAPRVRRTRVPVAVRRDLSTLREALRGSHGDFTEGPIGRAVILLAVPMVLEMALESVFAVVDVFWVSKLGAGAVATVGLTESMLALLYALAIGLSMAATATVARRIGERDRERAARTAVQAIALGVCVAVPLGVAGALLAPRLLALMGASPDVVASGWKFTAVMLGGNVVIVLLFLINAIFRGAGDAAVAMRVLWFANAINLVLDPCLIFGLGSVPGARRHGRGRRDDDGPRPRGRPPARDARARHRAHRDPAGAPAPRPDDDARAPEALGQRRSSSRSSGPRAGSASCGSSRASAARRSRATRSRSASSSSRSCRRGGCRTRRRRSWARTSARRSPTAPRARSFSPASTTWCSSASSASSSSSFPGALVGLFTQRPRRSRPIAAQGLRIIAAGFLFYAWGMVLVQAFNGAGDTWTPTVINLFIFWLWEIPLAYLLAVRAGLGPRGVFLAIAIAFSTLAVVGASPLPARQVEGEEGLNSAPMHPGFRAAFNAAFTPALAVGVRAGSRAASRPEPGFRLAETPVFLTEELAAALADGARAIVAQLSRPEALLRMKKAIPARWAAPGMDALPSLAQVDFAIVKGTDGRLVPRLIELQGFPSLSAFEVLQADAWNEALSAAWTASRRRRGARTSPASTRDGFVALLRAHDRRRRGSRRGRPPRPRARGAEDGDRLLRDEEASSASTPSTRAAS